jgi:hypothetical protein
MPHHSQYIPTATSKATKHLNLASADSIVVLSKRSVPAAMRTRLPRRELRDMLAMRSNERLEMECRAMGETRVARSFGAGSEADGKVVGVSPAVEKPAVAKMFFPARVLKCEWRMLSMNEVASQLSPVAAQARRTHRRCFRPTSRP